MWRAVACAMINFLSLGEWNTDRNAALSGVLRQAVFVRVSAASQSLVQTCTMPAFFSPALVGLYFDRFVS